MKKLVWVCAILWVGCVGRQVDENGPAIIDQAFNFSELKTEKASLVVFGAGWCKPCIKEIAAIEEIHQEYSSRIEVVGYLVEGTVALSEPTQTDIDNFQHYSVERTYPVYADKDWEKYSEFKFEKQSVPTVILLDENKNMIDYKQVAVSKSELKEWVLSKLDSNNRTTPEEVITEAPRTGTSGPTELDGTSFSIDNFLSFYDDSQQTVFKSSWNQGVVEWIDGDPEDSPDLYPFEKSTVEVDYSNEKSPVDMTYIKTTYNEEGKPSQLCTLTIKMTLDGTFVKQEGYCEYL